MRLLVFGQTKTGLRTLVVADHLVGVGRGPPIA